METNNQIEEIKFEVNYPGFSEFQADCMDRIYRKFLFVYETLYLSGIETKKMVVHAKIDGVVFDSVFEISRENTDLLTDTICKYFEEIEEYETCSKIMKMCS
jgi:hypothetical protein